MITARELLTQLDEYMDHDTKKGMIYGALGAAGVGALMNPTARHILGQGAAYTAGALLHGLGYVGDGMSAVGHYTGSEIMPDGDSHVTHSTSHNAKTHSVIDKLHAKPIEVKPMLSPKNPIMPNPDTHMNHPVAEKPGMNMKSPSFISRLMSGTGKQLGHQVQTVHDFVKTGYNDPKRLVLGN